MKLIITRYIRVWSSLLVFILLGFNAKAVDPGVLHMLKNEYNSYFNLEVDLNSDLLQNENVGAIGEATIEFWIKSAEPGNDWRLTDLSDNGENFSLSMHDEHFLKLKAKDQSYTIDLSAEVSAGTWHHVALAISDNASEAKVIINGKEYGVYEVNLNDLVIRSLYFYKKKEAEIFLTEIRLWSSSRDAMDVSMDRWQTYVRKGNLETQKQSGLISLLADTNIDSPFEHVQLPGLTNVKWNNYIGANHIASGVSKYKNTTLLEISQDASHPILNNNIIFLTASKGKDITDPESKIDLRWNHVKDVNGYEINRTDITTGQVIKRTVSYAGNPELTYHDATAIPGRLYEYKIVANDIDNIISGVDQGYVYYNGSIEGRINSQVGNKPIQDVEVTTTPQWKQGAALKFNDSNQQITVNNVAVFRKNADYTISFWYKGSLSTGVNGIYQLGDSKIEANGNQMQVVIGNEVRLTNTIPDNKWHHYAIVFAAEGSMFIDGALAENNSQANLLNIPANNVYSFQINYNTANEYELDEFRAWDWNLEQAASRLPWFYNSYLAGDETDLMLNYRFDLKGTSKIYNLSEKWRADYYTGYAKNDLTYNSTTIEQIDLVYKAKTNMNGDYFINNIAYDTQDQSTFHIIPFKDIEGYPDLQHQFDPGVYTINLKYDTDSKEKYQKIQNFIDISQMPISGLFYYYEPSESNEKIPAPMGITMMVDGVPQSEEEALSDINGNYLIYSALGNKTFKVSNPNVLTYTTGAQSLQFSGSSYAKLDKIPNHDKNEGTWTGFIKKSNNGSLEQTILNIGNGLELKIKNNTHLVLTNLVENEDLIFIDNALNTSDWMFFGLTYQAGILTLQVGNNEQKTASAYTYLPNPNLYVGAKVENDSLLTPFNGYLDQLEYRDTVYANDDIIKIKSGKISPLDAKHLKLSYSFSGNDSTFRAISSAPNSHNTVLNLYGALKTQFESVNYQKSYKTNYVPANEDEKLAADIVDESYTTEVLSPKSELDFEITNRYSFTGYIETPCGYGAGEWSGSIKRTDLPVGYTFEKQITKANFNEDNTVFGVDGLVPGYYKVKLVNQDNGRVLENFKTIKIDSASFLYEFDWKNPVAGATSIYAISQSGKYDSLITPLCNGVYALESGVSYEMEIKSFELYGQDTCMINQIEYTASGDLAQADEYSGEINEGGKTRMIFTAGTPNYSAPATPRKLTLTLTRTGGIVEQFNAEIKAYITGSEMTSPNFTIVNPDVMTVLHDPPGDNSYITLNSGTTISRTIKHSINSEVSSNFGLEFGNEYNNSVLIGGFVGGVINQLLKSRISVTTSASVNHAEGGDWTTTHSSTIKNSITTNAAQDIVGEDADVFIGRGQIMTIGQGRKIVIQACTPILENNRDVVKFDYTTPFYYTAAGIKGVLQNQLKIIVEDPNSSAEQIADANTEYNKWLSILTENIDRINNIDEAASFTDSFFTGHEEIDDPEKFTISGDDEFSFGGKVNIQLDVNTTENQGNTYNNSTKIGSGYASSSNVAAVGFLAKLTSSVNLSVEHTYSNAYQDEKVKGYTINLLDDEVYDHFSVAWKADPKYGTPMFKTFAGQSKCPYESGTENREGLEMIALGATDQTAAVGEQIDYQLKLTNTQLAIDNQKKSYVLSVDNASNNGVTVLFNGNPFINSQTFTMHKDSAATPVISIISDHSTEEEVILKFMSACEADGGSLLFSMDKLSNAKLFASVNLKARFVAPCVEAITVAAPVNNHVIIKGAHNIIPFRFKVVNPVEGLTGLKVEYIVEGSSEIQSLPPGITLDDEHKDVQGFYNYNINVAALQDKTNYQFRITPACTSGTSDWGKDKTPSEWINIRIDKELPTITGVNPANNTEWKTGNSIIVNYNKVLSTVVPNNITLDMVKNDEATPNIPKHITVSDRQLVITPTYTDKDLEGGMITVNIPKGEIKDIYGNGAEAFTWSFLVNKNPVTWESANIQKTAPLGTDINFSLGIRNDGVLQSSYKLVDFPIWLSATNKEIDHDYSLYGSGYRDQVNFVISNLNTEGIYNHIVQAETPNGIESFRLEVTVTSQNIMAKVSEVNDGFVAVPNDLQLEHVEAEIGEESIATQINCYPNPFKGSTTIAYQLTKSADVHLMIFDMMGRQVKSLVHDQQTEGNYEYVWERSTNTEPGVYLIKLMINDKIIHHRVLAE